MDRIREGKRVHSLFYAAARMMQLPEKVPLFKCFCVNYYLYL
jgi:hypothetical protein